MNTMTYIVTGAAGHLGSHVVRELLTQGKRVRALVLPGESCPPLIDENREFLTEYTGNVCVPDSLEQLFADGQTTDFTVIHCAGLISILLRPNRRVFEVNVGGTANVIEACRRHQVKRLVYVSSVHAIPLQKKGKVMQEVLDFDPASVVGCYAKTKATATQLVLGAARDGLDAVVVHPSGIIGPYAQPTGNMAQMIVSFLKGKFRAVINGGYDFVDVRDVAAGVVAAAEKGRRGECYILSNRYVEIRELLGGLSEITGGKKPRVRLPLWFAKTLAPCAELYYKLARKTPFFTLYSLHTISHNSLYSNDKARRELGYKTRPLKDTLADIVSWFGDKKPRK